MAISVTCPKCAHALKAKDGLAGKKVMCPQCQAIIAIPAAKPVAAAAAATSPASSTPTAKESAPAARSATTTAAAPTIAPEQVLGAFQGRIQPPGVSLVRRLGTWLVLGVLVGLVLAFAALLGGLAWTVYWLATSDFGPQIPAAAVSLAMAAAAILLVCLIRPLVAPQRRTALVHPLPADKHKLLADFVGRIAEQTNSPPPGTIQTECSPRLTVDAKGRTLTIGLPLVMVLSVEQLAGLVAAQFAQHRRRAGCGPANLIRAINGWLWRSVYQEDRFDRWISRVNMRPGFHFGRLLLPLRAFSFLARVVLWIPMFIGNTVAAVLARESELDADRAAARLIGAKNWAVTLERLKVVNFTWEGILTELPFLSKEQQLPDSLPHFLAERMADVTPELAATLLQTVIKEEDIPFDSRPSDAERLEAIRNEPESEIFTCHLPARGLLADCTATARQVTWDYYVARFGPQLLKTGLKKVQMAS